MVIYLGLALQAVGETLNTPIKKVCPFPVLSIAVYFKLLFITRTLFLESWWLEIRIESPAFRLYGLTFTIAPFMTT